MKLKNLNGGLEKMKDSENIKNKEMMHYDLISEDKKENDKLKDKSTLFYSNNLDNTKIIQTQLNEEDSDDNKSLDEKKNLYNLYLDLEKNNLLDIKGSIIEYRKSF